MYITIAFLATVIIIGLFIISKCLKDSEKGEKSYTETICGNCGGPDCIVGCDKPQPYDPSEAADKAYKKLHKELCKSIGIEQPISDSFIKPEKERIVTEDEIRHNAYLIASNDNFTKHPDIYWHESVKQLKGNK